MIKEIKKNNSRTFARITGNTSDSFLASILQGDGFEQVYLDGRWFKTIKGAERWIMKQFA